MDPMAEKFKLWLKNPPGMTFPTPAGLPPFSKKSFRNYDEMNAWKREYLKEIATRLVPVFMTMIVAAGTLMSVFMLMVVVLFFLLGLIIIIPAADGGFINGDQGPFRSVPQEGQKSPTPNTPALTMILGPPHTQTITICAGCFPRPSKA